ncbi:MAG TPA: alpha/beta hydrolase [Chitinivibrionales bacterium]|nr:alpha/beta hydrolase [Chitinivibrionales bacterium]
MSIKTSTLIHPIVAFLCVPLFLLCLPRTVIPLRTITYERAPHKDGLLVYLPGFGDSITVLQGNGIIDSIKAYAPSFDVVSADVHYGYYADRTLHERVTKDIIDPANAKGYRRIWFLGNSMGGLGSQLYAWKHPGVIEGIILMGPYTTSKGPIQEITKAGGLSAWSMPAKVDEKDWERPLWQWLKGCAGGGPGCPRIYVAYGVKDKLAPGIRILEQALPKGHVVELEGGHDWPVWKEGLMRLLREGVLK